MTLVAVTDDDDGNRQFGRMDARCGSACVGFARQGELARAGNVAAVVAGPHTEERSTWLASPSTVPGLVADLTETDHEHVFLMLLSSVFRIVNTTPAPADAITRLDAAYWTRHRC